MKRLPYKRFLISRAFFISDYHSRISATKFISAVKMKNSTSCITYISKNLACNFFNMEHFAYTVNINAYRNMKHLTYKCFLISRTFFISDYHSRISATKIYIWYQCEKFNVYITYMSRNPACKFLSRNFLGISVDVNLYHEHFLHLVSMRKF